MSKADFIAQGDAICKANAVSEKAIPKPSSNDVKAYGSVLSPLVAIVADEVVKLRVLKAPSADQATINAALAEIDTAVADTRKAVDAANAGNSAAFQSNFQASAAPSNDATTKLHAYGFQYCPSTGGSAQGGTTPTQAPNP